MNQNKLIEFEDYSKFALVIVRYFVNLNVCKLSDVCSQHCKLSELFANTAIRYTYIIFFFEVVCKIVNL